MNKTILWIVVGAGFVSLSLWFGSLRAKAADPGAEANTLDQRVAVIEKRMKVMEDIAFTPDAVHAYVRREASALAGDGKAGELVVAITKAENADSPQAKKKAYREAEDIIEAHNKENGQACPQHCQDEFDKCTDSPTACFGRYIVCCKAK